MRTIAVAWLCAISLVFAGHAFADIDPNTVVGAWLFDESAGDVAKDSSFNGNDGTLVKSPERVDGKFGRALEFDGTNGVEIDQPANFDFLTWTYVLWFRAEAGGDYPNLIGRQFGGQHGWTFHLDPAGATFRIRIDTDGGINQVKTVPAPVRDGEWHHGAIAHDDEEKNIISGAESASRVYGAEGAQNSWRGGAESARALCGAEGACSKKPAADGNVKGCRRTALLSRNVCSRKGM